MADRDDDMGDRDNDGSDGGIEDLDNDGQIDVLEEDAQDAEVDVGAGGMRREKNVDRITSTFMTKYEKARVLGTRAL
jgi:hypothetical protein